LTISLNFYIVKAIQKEELLNMLERKPVSPKVYRNGLQVEIEPYKEGDWIITDNKDYGLLKGYINSFSNYPPKYVITITEAEDINLVGKTITIKHDDIRPIPADMDAVYYEEGYVLNLIDFALLVRDKPLFLQLTARLKRIREVSKDA
jgi:hypothetical protein